MWTKTKTSLTQPYVLATADTSNRRRFIKNASIPAPVLMPRADINALIIATPWQHHYPVTKAALPAGKHVACGPIPLTAICPCKKPQPTALLHR